MTKDEIIRMALQAGIFHEYDSEGHWDGLTNEALVGSDWLISKEHKLNRIAEILAPFVTIVVAAEREACAKVCEENATDLSEGDWDSACINCADHIRTRSQHGT